MGGSFEGRNGRDSGQRGKELVGQLGGEGRLWTRGRKGGREGKTVLRGKGERGKGEGGNHGRSRDRFWGGRMRQLRRGRAEGGTREGRQEGGERGGRGRGRFGSVGIVDNSFL